ncbi:DNA-binding transcriptional LysR family regulator [Desulfitispora alkaliphila]|uniref:LysR family transcriptional regulator n=1 Tax=Desulfitispora alkaliphila TaxID=622674 RepID=UPI003D2439B7
MDIRHLEYFVEVAKNLSFTKASYNLHVSQPSISKMIKSLEDELGVPLFYRSSKQLQLTDAGKALLGQAQYILESFQNLTLELADVIQLKKGAIKIGLPPIIGASFFPKIIGQFKEVYPLVEIKLTEAGTKMIEIGVEEGTLDVGIVCSLPTKKDTFEQISLLKDPLMLVVNPNHKLANKEKVVFNDFQDEYFVLYREDFSLHDRIMEKCLEYGFYPKNICESSQRDFMVEMVANRLGITLLPEIICNELDPTKVKAIPFKQPEIFLELSIIWKKDKYLSFAAREWLEFIRKHMI